MSVNNTNLVIYKQLALLQDLALGSGTVTQVRNGVEIEGDLIDFTRPTDFSTFTGSAGEIIAAGSATSTTTAVIYLPVYLAGDKGTLSFTGTGEFVIFNATTNATTVTGINIAVLNSWLNSASSLRMFRIAISGIASTKGDTLELRAVTDYSLIATNTPT